MKERLSKFQKELFIRIKMLYLRSSARLIRKKSFAVYGIDLPKIRELLSTDLPKIAANEKSIDNLSLLEDGTYAIVDYESVYK